MKKLLFATISLFVIGAIVGCAQGETPADTKTVVDQSKAPPMEKSADMGGGGGTGGGAPAAASSNEGG